MTREEILEDLNSLERRYQRGKIRREAYEAEKAELHASLSLQGADAFETGHALPRPPMGWVEGGQIAGRYHLRALVGRGGMAEVWQAEDPASSPPTPVALKRLLASLAEHPSLQQRLAREIQILRKLRHPRLIQLLDFADGLFCNPSLPASPWFKNSTPAPLSRFVTKAAQASSV